MQVLQLPLSQVKVPEGRQRTEFDGEALGKLMDSIVEDGLRHPISVREEGGEYILVNGERRLKAISNLAGLTQPYRFGGVEWSPEFIPAISDGALDPLAAESAEFAENEYRENLTWQDRASATARLADLRRRQALALGRPQPGVDELALEVRSGATGPAREDTRREIILASQLHRSEIKDAPNLNEAWKAHLRAETQARNIELARIVGTTFGAHSHP